MTIDSRREGIIIKREKFGMEDVYGSSGIIEGSGVIICLCVFHSLTKL